MKLTLANIFPAFLLVSVSRAACTSYDDDRVIVSDAASSATGLQSVFESFKSLLGGNDNVNEKAARNGFRSVNWDAEVVPFKMPGDFFKNTVTRGLTIRSKWDDFRVSNDPDQKDNLFNSVNAKASKNFITFSPQRLFTPNRDNKIELTFSPAGKNGKATVNGFGAIFVDVDKARTTKMTALDKKGCILFEEYVKPSNKGLSFLGVAFGEGNDIIAKVIIKLGNTPINKKKTGLRENKKNDIVVLDDFLYGEPQRVRY